MTPFERVGTELRGALGAALDASRRARQRQTLAERIAVRVRPRWLPLPRRWAVALAGGALLGGGALGLVLLGGVGRPAAPAAPATLAQSWLEVGGRAVAGDGTWVEAPGHGSVDLIFAAGGAVRLEPRTRVRVARAAVAPAAPGAEAEGGELRVTLEQGRLAASIRPGGRGQWIFEAGPVSVRVLGTDLRVGWEPARAHAEVEVTRGRVAITDGPHGARGLNLVAGQRLDADVRAGTVTLSGAAPSGEVIPSPSPAFSGRPPSDELAVPSDPGLGGGASERAAQPTARRAPRKPRPEVPDWKHLAVSGDHRGALAATDAATFSGLLVTLDRSDLSLLADAARLAGQGERAKVALVALRRRFPETAAAALAAFRLGRVAVDLDRDSAGAARWYETYLRESPEGSFAGEARGRLVQALADTGDRSAAHAAARAYLERHPAGPYADLARTLVD